MFDYSVRFIIVVLDIYFSAQCTGIYWKEVSVMVQLFGAFCQWSGNSSSLIEWMNDWEQH